VISIFEGKIIPTFCAFDFVTVKLKKKHKKVEVGGQFVCKYF